MDDERVNNEYDRVLSGLRVGVCREKANSFAVKWLPTFEAAMTTGEKRDALSALFDDVAHISKNTVKEVRLMGKESNCGR